MRSRSTTVAGIFLLCAALASSARAGCPDPLKSFAPARLVSCPAGDSVFVVVARFFNNNPVAGRWITLDFRGCAGFRLAPPTATESFGRDPTGRRIWMRSDLNGVAAFAVRGGGACEGGFVSIGMCAGDPADTVMGSILLGDRPVVSFDQNGDMVVDQQDVDLANAKLGRSDPSADFDGDGFVTSADVALLSAHFGHEAVAPTPAERGSWGRLKIRYR